MGIRLRPVEEQVMVITGADSGIGLATARLAAERGARLVLNSRNEAALAQIAADLRADFHAQVEWYAGDVAEERAMLELAEVAVRAFGRIDTWVNNAGVSIYGTIEEVPVDDVRRLFDTNYFGVVNGCLAALPYLRARGGALINVGSVVGDRSVPLQGHYSASKHAVKGFTDALRTELEKEGAPVAVTLVKPSSINTPYTRHARNYMDDGEPYLPAPVYAPEVVAEAILECAETPRRSITVGGGGRMLAMMGMVAPRLADKQFEAMMFSQQKREHRPGGQEDTLYEPPMATGEEWGDYEGHTMRSSAYTQSKLHNVGKAAAVLALFGAGFALSKRMGLLGGMGTRDREMSDDDIEVTVRGRNDGMPPDQYVVEETYVVATVDPAGEYPGELHSSGAGGPGYGTGAMGSPGRYSIGGTGARRPDPGDGYNG